MTPKQSEAIKNAYDEIMHLSQSSNWGDSGAWKDALRLERHQGLTIRQAKGNCVKAWLMGASDPKRPAHEIYHMREGYLRAFLLGVRQYMERSKCEYTGPLFAKAFEAAQTGAEAYERHMIEAIDKSLAQLRELAQ